MVNKDARQCLAVRDKYTDRDSLLVALLKVLVTNSSARGWYA